MKHLERSIAIASLFFICWPSFAKANLVIQVGNGTDQLNPVMVDQGQDDVLIQFQILATNDSVLDDSFDLESYNFTIDFLGDGFVPQGTGSMDGFSDFGVVPGAYNNDGNVTFTDGQAQFALDTFGATVNYDFAVGDANSTNPTISDGGGAIDSDGTPLGLFALRFDVGLGVATGIYDVLVVANPTVGSNQSFDFQTDPGGQTIEIRQGSFQVNAVAVPEPSSIVALACLSATCLLRRSRKRSPVSLA